MNSGYHLLRHTLHSWGITCYAGVTGGGVVHFLRHLPPVSDAAPRQPAFFSIAEYPAGFIPLGYYLATGTIAAAVATTGAASKLLCCGLSDAKLHNIPAVYLLPLSAMEAQELAPLQDTSVHGSNIVAQLRAELPDGVFVLDDPQTLSATLSAAWQQLENSKPVVLFLLHQALNRDCPHHEWSPPASRSLPETTNFIPAFRQAAVGRRVVILAGEEMAHYPNAPTLTSALCDTLQAAIIWSINGASSVERVNPWGYGAIAFGGNDEALALFDSLGEEDVLLVLGAIPDEYTVNMRPFAAAHTFYLSNIRNAYGEGEHHFAHRASGAYHHIVGPLDMLLQRLIEDTRHQSLLNNKARHAPENLNHRPLPVPRAQYVDMAALYRRLDSHWPDGALGFDDVCLAYKDRQYVTQRPDDTIRFHSLYRGSAMGGAFGAAVGAKLAAPHRPVFLFTGDGCFRLFAGSLGEAQSLGLVIFLLNNASYAIVSQGLPTIIPDADTSRYHATLAQLDYGMIARACGWQAKKLRPDLSNLDALLALCASPLTTSLLIEIPVDSQQILGANPRAHNL